MAAGKGRIVKATEGSLRLEVAQGRKRATVRVWVPKFGGWMWAASRVVGRDELVKAGNAKSWATAYRLGMRAAERLLAKEAT